MNATAQPIKCGCSDRSAFQPFPVSCPGTIRDRPARLCYACFVPTGSAAQDGLSPSFPCTGRHCTGKTKERMQDSTQHHAPGKNCCKWMPSQRSKSSPGSIPLVGPALPVRTSRRFASLCFHSAGQNWGRPSKRTIAPLHGCKEESLLI